MPLPPVEPLTDLPLLASAICLAFKLVSAVPFNSCVKLPLLKVLFIVVARNAALACVDPLALLIGEDRDTVSINPVPPAGPPDPGALL